MKKLIRAMLVLVSLAVFTLCTIGCSDLSTAPVHAQSVTLKFISPATDEIIGENMLEVNFENVATGATTKIKVAPSSVVLTPVKVFDVYETTVDLPTGDIGEKVSYRMNARFLGFPDQVSFPSQDVSHLITINGSAPWVGDGEGMRFSVSCDGDVEFSPSLAGNETFSYRPNVSVSTFMNQFVGDISIFADELILSADGKTSWRPLLSTYEWATEGNLLTYRYRKVADANHSPSTQIQIPPSSHDRYIRVRANLESGGNSFNITGQMNIFVPGEMTSDEPNGYRIYRIYGSGSGKG